MHEEAHMAILRREVMNKSTEYAANQILRDAIVSTLYAQTIVIRKFTVAVDGETLRLDCKYGTIGSNPVAEAFGLDYDVRVNNLPVEVSLQSTDKTEARRITIDGDRYIFCSSLIMIKCEDEATIKLNDSNGFVYAGNTYRVLGASPSNEKKSVKFFYKVTDQIADERAAFDIVDEISGHVFSAKFAKLVDGKTVTKLNTRWMNYLTTMKCMAEIDLNKDYIAVIHEERDENGNVTKEGAAIGAYDFDKETKEKMDAVGIKIDNHINDGAKINTVPLVQEIAAFNGIELTEEEALGVALQERDTMLTSKVMNITMTEEDALNVANNNNATFYGNRNGRLMCVVDEDGAKAINVQGLLEANEPIKVYVLAMAKASDVRTNGQHLIKYMAVDKEATLNFLRKQFGDKLDEFFMNKLNEDETAINSVNAQLINRLGQDAVKNTALMETLISDVINYATSAIAKTRVGIDGIYSHMSFDWTYAITGGLVDSLLEVTPEGFVEAYSRDVNRKLAKETKAIENNPNLSEDDKRVELFRQRTGVVIKHPSAMPDEYEIVYYLTEKQMKQRIIDKLMNIKDNKRRAELRDRLMRYILNSPWGVTVYAPLNSMKHKLAGADVDFDATLTDMSELKHILIKARLEEQKNNLGSMGKCVFISYKDIDRSALVTEDVTDIDM
jgi:hypothetical protein